MSSFLFTFNSIIELRTPIHISLIDINIDYTLKDFMRIRLYDLIIRELKLKNNILSFRSFVESESTL
jgi:hypothetical protein